MQSRFFLVAITVCLVGCAVEAISPDAARSFRDVSVDSFLQNRFSDPQSKRYDGKYLYEAYFNLVNYRQLERPVSELRSFCIANDGNFINVKKFTGDPIGAFIANPFLWAEEFRRAQLSVSPSLPSLSRTAAEIGYDSAIRFNTRFKTTEAKEAFEKVAAKGAFGIFECRLKDHASWQASVLPIGFKLKDANNDLSNNVLFLQISKL